MRNLTLEKIAKRELRDDEIILGNNLMAGQFKRKNRNNHIKKLKGIKEV